VARIAIPIAPTPEKTVAPHSAILCSAFVGENSASITTDAPCTRAPNSMPRAHPWNSGSAVYMTSSEEYSSSVFDSVGPSVW
jgi:hypothetical protein